MNERKYSPQNWMHGNKNTWKYSQDSIEQKAFVKELNSYVLLRQHLEMIGIPVMELVK